MAKYVDPEKYWATDASRSSEVVANLEGRHYMKHRARHDAPEDLEEPEKLFLEKVADEYITLYEILRPKENSYVRPTPN